MSFRSINVIIEPRHYFPWITQKIQVDGNPMFQLKRSYGLLSVKIKAEHLRSQTVEFRIYQPFVHRAVFEINANDKLYKTRKISYWQWECRCDDEVILVNRLGGSKCVLSQDGRQLAIISLGTNLPFMKDRNTYVRVNSDECLHISVAMAVLVNGFGFNINPFLLNNNKLSSRVHPIEIA